MQFRHVLYGPVYKVLGNDKPETMPVLTVLGVEYPINILNKTVGVDLAGDIDIETSRPMAAAMVGDILDQGLQLSDLDQAVLTMDGKNYEITSHKPAPTTSGEADGEVYMFLERIAE